MEPRPRTKEEVEELMLCEHEQCDAEVEAAFRESLGLAPILVDCRACGVVFAAHSEAMHYCAVEVGAGVSGVCGRCAAWWGGFDGGWE